MKFISPRIHGYLDYATVAVFALAPVLLELSGVPMLLSYGLAVVHFLMTIATDFSMGMFKLIPLKLHGMVEFAVGLAIPATPFLLGFTGVAFYFFLLAGIAIFVVGLVSIYEEETPTSAV